MGCPYGVEEAMYIVEAGFGVFLLTCSLTILDSIRVWEAQLRTRSLLFGMYY